MAEVETWYAVDQEQAELMKKPQVVPMRHQDQDMIDELNALANGAENMIYRIYEQIEAEREVIVEADSHAEAKRKYEEGDWESSDTTDESVTGVSYVDIDPNPSYDGSELTGEQWEQIEVKL